MNNEKYCYECDAFVDTETKEIEEIVEVKGINIPVKSNITYCKKCGERLFDKKLDSANLINAFDKYKKEVDLLQSEEILQIKN